MISIAPYKYTQVKILSLAPTYKMISSHKNYVKHLFCQVENMELQLKAIIKYFLFILRTPFAP